MERDLRNKKSLAETKYRTHRSILEKGSNGQSILGDLELFAVL